MSTAADSAKPAAVPLVSAAVQQARQQQRGGRLIEPRSKKYVGAVLDRDFKWIPFESVLKALEWDVENGTHVISMTQGHVVIKTDMPVKCSEYETQLIYYADGSKPELQLKVMLNVNSDDFAF